MNLNLYTIAGIGAFLTLVAIVVGVYSYSSDVTATKIEHTELQEYKKDVIYHDKIDKDVRRLDTTDLDRALSNWMRP